MKKAKRLLLWTVAGVAALFAVGCYRGDPPCNPSTVDWPRCRPWDPAFLPRSDGGGQ